MTTKQVVMTGRDRTVGLLFLNGTGRHFRNGVDLPDGTGRYSYTFLPLIADEYRNTNKLALVSCREYVLAPSW